MCVSAWTVLIHHIQIGILGQMFCDPGKYLIGSGKSFGHDQMTDQQAFACNSVFIQSKIPYLFVHFLEGMFHHIRIVRCIRQFTCHLGLTELAVRHVDVHKTVKEVQRFFVVITARVVHEWNPQAVFNGEGQSLDDLRDHVTGGNEINVVAALSLKGDHESCKAFRFYLMPCSFMADIVILTKAAVKIAVCKEDRSGTPASHERGLFSKVGTVTGNDGPSTGPAEPLFSFEAVHSAFPWAQHAGSQSLLQMSNLGFQVSGRKGFQITCIRHDVSFP